VTLLYLLVNFFEYTFLTVFGYAALLLLLVCIAYSQFVVLKAQYGQGKTVENPFNPSSKSRRTRLTSSVTRSSTAGDVRERPTTVPEKDLSPKTRTSTTLPDTDLSSVSPTRMSSPRSFHPRLLEITLWLLPTPTSSPVLEPQEV